MRPTKENREDSIRRASPPGSPIFNPGDPVLLKYAQGARQATVLATIVRHNWSLAFDLESVSSDLRFTGYTVSSQYGGELIVEAANLRPGGVLDRLADVLDKE